MAKEDKKLLLRDLCARLPYGIICSCVDNSFTPPSMDYELASVNLQDENVIVCNGEWEEEFPIENITPYLRTMSSMTEEEEKKYNELMLDTQVYSTYFPAYEDMVNVVDWLNEHHFDYRNLIEKGLALQAPEDMYDFKELI